MTWADRIKAAAAFFNRNHAKWGALLLTLGGILATWGPDYAHASQITLALGGVLAGSGVGTSDSQRQAQQKWEREGVDRRTPPAA